MTTISVGQLININAWKACKAKQAIVVRTYKAPDDSMVLALPSSSEYFEPTLRAIATNTLDAMKSVLPGIYAQCRTFHASEFKTL